jgi:hypothetical protein
VEGFWNGFFSTLPLENLYVPMLYLLLLFFWKGWKGMNKVIGYKKINIKYCKGVWRNRPKMSFLRKKTSESLVGVRLEGWNSWYFKPFHI